MTRGTLLLNRILIFGGYGGFGARLTRRLASGGHYILVAGRNREKAARVCADIPGTEPLRADRNADVAQTLARHRPDLVIDAAGPFQVSGYQVPAACAQAGIAYLDLADARAFVTGIGTLDDAARAGGVSIISGASTLPALTGAVARQLAVDMTDVWSVDIALSASSRVGGGASVSAGILHYVGMPLWLWRGRRWVTAWGWQQLQRRSFAVAASPPLTNRWVALADLPDHDLLPAMLPGRPSVTIFAGTDSAAQVVGLWLLGWVRRILSLRSLGGLLPLLVPLQRLTGRFGGSRSAMSVAMQGVTARGPVERIWTIVAEDDDGPEIPTLAAEILAERILAGSIRPGARDAGQMLDLDAFEPLLAQLCVQHETIDRPLPPPLYRRVMGERFDRLPAAVREMHSIWVDAGAGGEARVEASNATVARLVAAVMRFPPPGEHRLHVAFTERNGVETWTRHFGRWQFRSRLFERDAQLHEAFGPLCFAFDLPSDQAGLAMRLRGWRLFGVPMPLALAPRITAWEWQEEDRFHFDVGIALPLIGQLIRYEGWLKRI